MKVFVVEDDRFYCKLIEHHVRLNPDLAVSTFATGQACLDHLDEQPDIVTLDFGLPDMDGRAVLDKIRKFNPAISVIVISGQADIAIAVNLLKEGAYDYIAKDENIGERLLHTIHHIQITAELRNQVDQLKNQMVKGTGSETGAVG